MIEGLSVTRHLDLVTHNHSNPANTPPVYYNSEATTQGKCKTDRENMEKRCKPDDKKGKKRKGAPKGKDTSKAGSWVLDHCGPLLVKPGTDFKDWLNDFGDLNKVIGEATSALKSNVISKLEKEVAEF